MGSGTSKKKFNTKQFNTNDHMDEYDDHVPITNRKTKVFSVFNNENTIFEKIPSPQIKKKDIYFSPEENPSSDSSLSSLEDQSYEENSKEQANSLSNGNSLSYGRKSHSSDSNNSNENEKEESFSEQSLDPIKDFIDYVNMDQFTLNNYLSPRTDNNNTENYENGSGFNSYNKTSQNQIKKKIVITSQLPDLNKEETNDEKKFLVQIVDYSRSVFKSNEGEGVQQRLPAKYKGMDKDCLHEIGINVISRKGSLSDTPNQDDYFIFIDQNFRIYSVFDGHGPNGHQISNLCYRLFMKRLLEDPTLFEDTANALKVAFKKIGSDMKEFLSKSKTLKKKKINMKFSGTTTTVIFQKEKTLYIAHLGDSRAVIGKKQKNKKFPYQLTTDHVPTLPQEKKRIYQNGGEVRKLNNDYVEKVFVRGRIYPGLSVSRSIGDEVGAFIGVIDEPEINIYEINEQNDQFLLLGSKPVFNYLEDYEIINILSSFSGKTVKMASDFLYKRVKSAWIQNENGFDDITLILIYF